MASEIADVRIMLEQVAYIVADMTAGSVTADNFECWVEEQRRVKLDRLCGMLVVKYEYPKIHFKEQVSL